MNVDDPDETEGRKLYRARADTLAASQMAIAKRTVKMSRTRAIPPVPEHIDPEKEDKRRALADFRIAENKPEVVKPPTEGKAN